MNKHSMRNLILAAMFGMAVSLVAGAASASAPTTIARSSLLVLTDDGRYLALDPISGTSLASGLYGDLTSVPTNLDGLMIADVYSADDGMLYALLTRDAQEDVNGAQRFAVVALDQHTLKVLRRYDLPQAQIYSPRLLMDAKRDALLLLTHAGIQPLAIRGDGSLEPEGPMVKASLVMSETYVDAQGRIIDGNQVYDRQGHLLQKVKSDSVLDAALRARFAALTRIKGTNEHYYNTILAASAGDRMVFTVGWDSAASRVPHAGIAVYDLNARRVISSFFSEFPVTPGEEHGPGIRLSPDGRHIINEQYEWLPSYTDKDPPRTAIEASRKSPFRTGKLGIYDADTGLLIGTVDLGPSSAPRAGAQAKVLGYSRDASQLYYWFDQHLCVIDLASARLISKFVLPKGYNPVTVVDQR